MAMVVVGHICTQNIKVIHNTVKIAFAVATCNKLHFHTVIYRSPIVSEAVCCVNQILWLRIPTHPQN